MRAEDNERLTRIRAQLDLQTGKRHKLTDVVRLALETLEKQIAAHV